jgi:hypothetical protein
MIFYMKVFGNIHIHTYLNFDFSEVEDMVKRARKEDPFWSRIVDRATFPSIIYETIDD